ncbi:MAG: class I adenylate-forming enzyme family protein [Brumimicrobium sp.]
MTELSAFKILIEASNKWPNSPAIYDEYGQMSFKELYEASNELCVKLRNEAIGPGMAIGVMSKNNRQFIIAIFGVIGTGATVMPMSHQLKNAEVNEIISEAGLHAIMDEYSGIVPLEDMHTIKTKDTNFRIGRILKNKNKKFAPHVENPAFMRFTSGTTGKSKGVIISHHSAIERIDAANRLLKLGPGDVVIWVLPIAYHFVVSILLYVKYGVAIAIAKDFLPQNIVSITAKYKGTLLYASPMQIRLLASIKEKASLDSLKMVISTSTGISVDVCNQFKEKYNIPVSQAYGIIEIGLPIINHSKSIDNPEAVGYALPDYDVQIMDDNNNPLPAGKVGHLAIKGPGMFNAYLKPARLREEIVQNGYFYTADFAFKSEDGLITVEGRKKSVINVSGNKVFPEEVEGVLETIPEIKLARISGTPHPLMGQIVQAELVLEDGAELEVEEVLTYCRKRLSTFKVPQRVLIVDSLPLTKTGKVKRF